MESTAKFSYTNTEVKENYNLGSKNFERNNILVMNGHTELSYISVSKFNESPNHFIEDEVKSFDK